MTEEEFRKRREAALKRRSQAVQRDLPRPTEMNENVLRPISADHPLTEMQRAEELIKREMLVMLHHDCLETPTPAQMGEGSSKKKSGNDRAIVNEQVHRNYVERHPYEKFSDEEIANAKDLLKEEMKVVKQGMNHGDITLDIYTQVKLIFNGTFEKEMNDTFFFRCGRNVWLRFCICPLSHDTQEQTWPTKRTELSPRKTGWNRIELR